MNDEWRIKPGKLEEFKKKFEAIGLGQLTPLEDRTKISRTTLNRIWNNQGWRTDMAQLDALIVPLVSTNKSTAKVSLTPAQEQKVEELKRDYSDIRKAQSRNRGRNKATANEPALSCITVYTKFIHLKDVECASPAYRRFVKGLKQEYDVFSEISIVKTLCFNTVPASFKHEGLAPLGVADLQSILPPRIGLVSTHPDRSPEAVEHIEQIRHESIHTDRLFQTALVLLNRFQRSQEYTGVVLPEDCDRVILIVDLTSLPIDPARLFTTQPSAYHIRKTPQEEQKLKMDYEESDTGMYMLDSKKCFNQTYAPDMWNPRAHTLLKHDQLHFQFYINWDEVNKQK